MKVEKLDRGLTFVDVGRICLFARTLALLLIITRSGRCLLCGSGKGLNIDKPQRRAFTHFFAAFAPSVDLAGALPAVEAGAFCAVDTGFGGIMAAVGD